MTDHWIANGDEVYSVATRRKVVIIKNDVWRAAA
jgi:hypothetical protein